MRAVLLYLAVIVTVIWMAGEDDFDREHLPITSSRAPTHISNLPLPDPHDLDSLSVVAPAHAGDRKVEAVLVNGALVNIRSGPGLSYRMLDVVERGAVIMVDGNWEENWAPVFDPATGAKGWINGAYITPLPSQ